MTAILIEAPIKLHDWRGQQMQTGARSSTIYRCASCGVPYLRLRGQWQGECKGEADTHAERYRSVPMLGQR